MQQWRTLPSQNAHRIACPLQMTIFQQTRSVALKQTQSSQIYWKTFLQSLVCLDCRMLSWSCSCQLRLSIPESSCHSTLFLGLPFESPPTFPDDGGQRVCPGRHFAKNEMIATFAFLISAYEIEMTSAECGVVEPDH